MLCCFDLHSLVVVGSLNTGKRHEMRLNGSGFDKKKAREEDETDVPNEDKKLKGELRGKELDSTMRRRVM